MAAVLGCPNEPAPGLEIVSLGLPTGTVGHDYIAVLYAWGGRGKVTWAASTLPPGLRLEEDWIAGVPLEAGDTEFTLFATDNASAAQESVLIRILDQPSQIQPGAHSCDFPVELFVPLGQPVLLDVEPTIEPLPLAGCSPESEASEVAYHFTVQQPSALVVEAPYEARVAMFRGTCGESSPVFCDPPGHSTSTTFLEPGEYYLLVAAVEVSRSNLVLHPRPHAETCATGVELGFVGDRLSWATDATGAIESPDPFGACGLDSGVYARFELEERSWLRFDGSYFELFEGTCDRRASIACFDWSDLCVGPVEPGSFVLRSSAQGGAIVIDRKDVLPPPQNSQSNQAIALQSGDLLRAYRGYESHYTIHVPEGEDLAIERVEPGEVDLTIGSLEFEPYGPSFRRLAHIEGDVRIKASDQRTPCDEGAFESAAFRAWLIDQAPPPQPCEASPVVLIDVGQMMTVTSSIGTGSELGSCKTESRGSTFRLTVQSPGYLTMYASGADASLHQSCDFSHDECSGSVSDQPVLPGEYVVRVESDSEVPPESVQTTIRLRQF